MKNFKQNLTTMKVLLKLQTYNLMKMEFLYNDVLIKLGVWNKNIQFSLMKALKHKLNYW